MKEPKRKKLLDAIDSVFKREIKRQWKDNGYVISDISKEAQEEMKILTKQHKRKFHPIFETIHEDGNIKEDTKRLQMILKGIDDYPRVMKYLETEIKSFASIFLEDYQPTSAVCIRSYKGGKNQQLHRDMTKQQYYLLQEEVHSCIVTTDTAFINVIHPVKNVKEKVEIPSNSLLIFHGRLVHSGSSYKKTNTRYHCYLGGQELQKILEKDEHFLDTSEAYIEGDTGLDWEFTDEELSTFIGDEQNAYENAITKLQRFLTVEVSPRLKKTIQDLAMS